MARQSAERRLKELGRESGLSYGRALFMAHHSALTAGLKALFEEAVINPTRARYHGAAYPFLDRFDSIDQIAAVALVAAIDQLTKRQRRVTFCQHIGKALEIEERLMRLRDRSPMAQRSLFRKGMSRRQVASPEVLRALQCNAPAWDSKARMIVGEFLLTTIVEHTGLFWLGRRKVGRHYAYMVGPSDYGLSFVKAVPPREARTSYSAMVSPPRPWLSHWGGGPLTNEKPLVHVHLHDSDRVEEVVKRLYEPARMDTVFKAVNHLQATPLQVSEEMARTVRTAWEGGIDGLFRCSRVPPEIPERLGSDPDPEALKRRNALAAAAHANRERYRCTRVAIERSIQSAEELAGSTVWQPHHADLRGRIYTMNRNLTHQGPDHEKALLSFEPQPIGGDGMDWILKAAAGHHGLSRAPWEERLAWGMANRERMVAVAEDPLSRFELWRNAKDPWQFLQLCRGYAEALKTGSTGVPIRFDQTTSGMGILAALLRQPMAGRLCNLYGDTPEDLYSVVAEKVLTALRTNLELGEDEKTRGLARFWLEIGVTRSIVKKPVLAAPYGGTYMTLADAVVEFTEEQLGYVPIEEFLYRVATPSKYLASIIWREMQEEIAPAMVLGRWLRACVRKAFEKGQPLQWTTPTGLPMEAADRRTTNTAVKTLLFGKRCSFNFQEAPVQGMLDSRAASRSISSNVVHSFDAALVSMVASAMADLNAPVLANHDCFAAPPSRASELHTLLLSTFRGLYQTDWLAVMREEIQSRSRVRMPKLPEYGDLEPGLIGGNRHLFS